MTDAKMNVLKCYLRRAESEVTCLYITHCKHTHRSPTTPKNTTPRLPSSPKILR